MDGQPRAVLAVLRPAGRPGRSGKAVGPIAFLLGDGTFATGGCRPVDGACTAVRLPRTGGPP
ncbi:hypothetical protein [Streptomyces sp. NPDC020983]|uniref:hypothetical protein n=1 Tax=Streptomyces sp. NPDC020983 TaxID=3365106 RepID=UPI0037AE17C2